MSGLIIVLALLTGGPTLKAAEIEVAAHCGDAVTLLVLSPQEMRRGAPGMVELGKRLVIQPMRETLLRRAGGDFRQGDVANAYDTMGERAFDDINGRQDWVNWRLIPRALNGRVSAGPISVIDLGCGPGSSTKILSHFVHPESRVLGIDLAPKLVEMARGRTYTHHTGRAALPEFAAGSATEPFRGADGAVVPEASVDFVNSSGIVGHYLDRPALETMGREVRRVLKPGGYVALDNGPHLVAQDIVPAMESLGFKYEKKIVLFPGDWRGQLVFRRP